MKWSRSCLWNTILGHVGVDISLACGYGVGSIIMLIILNTLKAYINMDKHHRLPLREFCMALYLLPKGVL